jgi:hypothetical protein
MCSDPSLSNGERSWENKGALPRAFLTSLKRKKGERSLNKGGALQRDPRSKMAISTEIWKWVFDPKTEFERDSLVQIQYNNTYTSHTSIIEVKRSYLKGFWRKTLSSWTQIRIGDGGADSGRFFGRSTRNTQEKGCPNDIYEGRRLILRLNEGFGRVLGCLELEREGKRDKGEKYNDFGPKCN